MQYFRQLGLIFGLCILLIGTPPIAARKLKSRSRGIPSDLPLPDFIAKSGYTRANPLTIHLIAHSHDDVGYEKTLDEYYYGSNSTIREAAVQYTLDTIVPTLLANPSRKFIQVEQAFFHAWWNEQDDTMKANVKSLLASGQLEFISGGWVMHDEASTYYIDMIDQMTLGHKFLLDEFDVIPRTGWQIDPFGHSNTNAGLLGANIGFDAMYMCRVDYQDKLSRMLNKQMEFIWQGSESLSTKASSIFSSLTVFHYGSPNGFCFDSVCDGGPDTPIEDDMSLEDYNALTRVAEFLANVLAQAESFQGNDVLITLGGDFQYSNAMRNFKEYDKIIRIANQVSQGTIVLQYSTPSLYTAAKLNTTGLNLSLKTDDFFPYADFPFQYWVGFFTSRPALKRYVRFSSAFLQYARQIEVLSGLGEGVYNSATRTLAEAMGVAQHHDAVSGTSMQHVAYDYALRLSKGYAAATDMLSHGLVALTKNSPSAASLQFQNCPLVNQSICLITQTQLTSSTLVVVLYNPLAHTRTSLVRIPVERTDLQVFDSNNQPVQSMFIANENGKTQREEIIARNAQRVKAREELVRQQRLDEFFDEDLSSSIESMESTPSAYTLVFQSQVQPMGINTYFIQAPASNPDDVILEEDADMQGESDESLFETRAGKPTKQQHAERKLASTPTAFASTSPVKDDLVSIENDLLVLSFSSSSGLLIGYTDKSSGTYFNYSLSQSYSYYQSFYDPTGKSPNSGAYISRFSNNNTAIPITPNGGGAIQLTPGVQGPLVWEMHQQFSEWVFQTVRLTLGSALVEFEYTIGPVPLVDDDGVTRGKEVITRFDMDPSSAPAPFNNARGMDNAGVWYTDSNGREFIQRVHNHRATWNMSHEEPVASNYMPVNSIVFMNDAAAASYDNDNTLQLTILTDRSQGCASLTNTSLEIMLHRRLIGDDNKGVHEPLNETSSITPYPDPIRIGPGMTITGSHYLLLQDASRLQVNESFAKAYRAAQSQIYFPVQTSFANLDSGDSIPNYLANHNANKAFSGELPENLDLITMQSWDNGTVLVRLAHNFAVGEDSVFSTPVQIDLQSLFINQQIQQVQEWSLTVNQPIEELWAHQQQREKLYRHHAAEAFQQNEAQRKNKKENIADTLEFADLQLKGTVVTIAPMEVRTFQITL